MKKYLLPGSILLVIAVSIGAYSLTGFSPTDEVTRTSGAEGEFTEDEYFKDLTDRFSYAYGADLADKFKLEGIELNVDLLADAMRASFKGEPTRMSTDEVLATIEVYRGVHIKKKEAEWEIAAEKNQKEGELFLAENAKKEGVIVTESGLQYRVIAEGNGEYSPAEDDEVTAHYRGMFIDGTEFDSTYTRNQPFKGMPRQLIEGWAEAVQMMSEGAKWELVVPAHLAYGERGSEPYVGPNAVLLFEVELLEVQKQSLSLADP